MEQTVKLNADTVSDVFGSFDFNLRKIEKAFSVTIVTREDAVKISGADSSVFKAVGVHIPYGSLKPDLRPASKTAVLNSMQVLISGLISC